MEGTTVKISTSKYGTFRHEIETAKKRSGCPVFLRCPVFSGCPVFLRFPVFTVIAPGVFVGLLYLSFACLSQDICFGDTSLVKR
jgi:hypothetical protein